MEAKRQGEKLSVENSNTKKFIDSGIMPIVRIVMLLLSFSVVGWLTGWLVGASSSPTVSAVLPLIFGLFTAVGLGYANALAKLKKIGEVIAASPDKGLPEIKKIFDNPHAAIKEVPLFITTAIVLFCLLCYSGVRHGVSLRSPGYPKIEELLGRNALLNYEDAAQLYRLRLSLQRQNISPDEVRAIFRDAVQTFLSDSRYRQGGELYDVRSIALKELVATLTSVSVMPTGPGRGPASVEP
jgi:hypothetical protein